MAACRLPPGCRMDQKNLAASQKHRVRKTTLARSYGRSRNQQVQVQHVCLVPQLPLTSANALVAQIGQTLAALVHQHVGTRKAKASSRPAVCTDSTYSTQLAHEQCPAKYPEIMPVASVHSII